MTSGSEMVAEVCVREITEVTPPIGTRFYVLTGSTGGALTSKHCAGQAHSRAAGTCSQYLTQFVIARAAMQLGVQRARWGEKEWTKDDLAATMTADGFDAASCVASPRLLDSCCRRREAVPTKRRARPNFAQVLRKGNCACHECGP